METPPKSLGHLSEILWRFFGNPLKVETYAYIESTNLSVYQGLEPV